MAQTQCLGAYLPWWRESVINIEEHDRVLDGAVLDGRNDSSYFSHCVDVICLVSGWVSGTIDHGDSPAARPRFVAFADAGGEGRV